MNKLYQGDCLEIMKDFEDKSIDCIVTDPPYSMTKNKWDKPVDLEKLWTEFKRIMKKDCQIVIFSKQPFTTDLINSNRKMFKYIWIWEKEQGTNFLNAKYMPLIINEDIAIFNTSIKYNPQMQKGSPHKTGLDGKRGVLNFGINRKQTINNGTRYPKNIIKYKRGLTTSHPTEKPVKLIEYLIKTYSNEADIILDPFAGSGTTAISAIRTNRKYILIEKEKEYCDIIQDRIEKEIDRTALFNDIKEKDPGQLELKNAN